MGFNSFFQYIFLCKKIQDLIGKGYVKQAIQMLIDLKIDGAILLMARFNRNEKDSMLGTIDGNSYRMESNKIVQAILHSAGSDSQTPIEQPQAFSSTDIETKLLRIAAENKRRNLYIYQEAQAILTEFREYKDQKAVNSLHDTNFNSKMVQLK